MRLYQQVIELPELENLLLDTSLFGLTLVQPEQQGALGAGLRR